MGRAVGESITDNVESVGGIIDTDTLNGIIGSFGRSLGNHACEGGIVAGKGIAMDFDIREAESLACRSPVVPRIEAEPYRLSAVEGDNGSHFSVKHIVGGHFFLGVD